MKKRLLTSMLFCSLVSLGFSDLPNLADGNSYINKIPPKKIQPPKQLNNNMEAIESQHKRIKKIKPKIKEDKMYGQQEISNMPPPPIKPKAIPSHSNGQPSIPPHRKINDQQKGGDDEYSNLTTNLQSPKENMQHNLNLLSDEDRKLNRQMMFDGPQEGFQNNKPRGI
ncbi:hypothetical protein IB642_00865 [Allofrancisella guangzhouensis]|uniref:Uncharacterized protein n=1 Tax=Allofrancisella guangzhouensis TaxID=594679 RepID=A0A0A8E4I0_9GAMM|nr:hypothetical protein [Allofrancisella guangzhouensis]AJC49105.1 hypothetical protein SD28_05385 [Allofrancisella guangzhouensis]MBK2026819.1 hypothetical protein [Allofrancisella guangzhouensis]MBK2043568.1 hypothetical protein [Allofrancisella guangzhouensis]MBK2046316.1 hypothetical protein [Allofrancisella guangzhouensis]